MHGPLVVAVAPLRVLGELDHDGGQPGVITPGQQRGPSVHSFHLIACKFNGKRVGIIRSRAARPSGPTKLAALAARVLSVSAARRKNAPESPVPAILEHKSHSVGRLAEVVVHLVQTSDRESRSKGWAKTWCARAGEALSRSLGQPCETQT